MLDMPLLDTRRGKDLVGTFLSDIVLQTLSFVAENERGNIRQRQKEGMDAAKQHGFQLGRLEKPLPDSFWNAYIRWESLEISGREAARQCGMAPTLFYRKAESMKAGQNGLKE